ncbi:MAG: gliding motility protein GldN [Prevotella sp.]|nr:gliding motility protein GldN [Prevotella sp.]
MNKRWVVLMALFTIHCSLFISETQAQPKKSRVQQTQQKQAQQQKQGTQTQQGMTRRMQISYPVALDMPEDVVWRRDIYRELDLRDEQNSGLYYPVQPQGKQLNLFTYIFKLAQNGYIPIYEYSVANDGNDDFSETAKVKLKTVLDNYHIFYEEQAGKLKIDNSDIPSQEVMKYFLKESAYYDQGNATFHIKPLALCPVMLREDDFGGEAAQYPLFWVKYSDLEPYLSRQTVMTSDVNNAAVMSMDDYFTLNKYKGKIYKTNNMLGKTLAQIAGGDTAKLSKEQQRIEAELEAFRTGIFGDQQKKDSLDSVANTKADLSKASKKERKARAKTEKASTRRAKSSSSSSGSSSARVSVRRQRH